jgi:serine O-acetyltransferase
MWRTIAADFHRIDGTPLTLGRLGRALLLHSGAHHYIFWMRTCTHARSSRVSKVALYPFARLMLRKACYRYGIDIPHGTYIGDGLYISHSGGIVVNVDARIGRNCNLSQGVTIGQGNRGRNKGAATIGDGVYFGPGSKVVGAVTIGNNVAIGANCVVSKDVPDNSVVVGIPGRVISNDGAQGYIQNPV